MSTSTATKRRRVSEGGEVQPPENPSAATTTTPAAVEPALEELPKLVFVDLQKDDEDAVKEALARLDTILYAAAAGDDGDEQLENELLLASAVPLILLTMHKWKMNEHIQLTVCNCLVNVFALDKEARVVMAQLGGLEAVVAALNSFPDSIDINRFACAALLNFCPQLGEDEPPANILEAARRFVQELNGLEIVATAMKKFPDDVDFQGWCVGLLGNFAVREEFHGALLKEGAVAAVAVALQRHLWDGYINQHANEFMKQVFGKDAWQNRRSSKSPAANP